VKKLICLLLVAACAKKPGGDPYAKIVAAADRSDDDRKLDGGRKPAATLAFAGVKPGMKVLDLGAGMGYTTELLARAVGPGGTVYGQNNQIVLGFAGEAWAARLAKPIMKNVTRLDQELDAPLPAGLDVVLFNAVYHDSVWMKIDRAKMNKAVFDALKPGGVYVVIDSSAKPGDGVNDAQTLHRIDEQVVLDEVQAAGFQLDAKGDFLRNPADTRDWNTSPRAAGERRGQGDRFAFRFRKPR
jgi:predicted methyltransferase